MKSFVAISTLLFIASCSASWAPGAWAPQAYGGWAHAAAPVQIHNGVPVDTPEVQHAKAAHFAAHAAASNGHYAPAHYAQAVPVIHNGVPVDTPEVQHAKAAHFAALAKASSGAHYAPAPAHYGAIHIPVIHNGVPVDTPEVQHARAAHLSALASAGGHGGHYAGQYDGWSQEDGSYRHDPTGDY